MEIRREANNVQIHDKDKVRDTIRSDGYVFN